MTTMKISCECDIQKYKSNIYPNITRIFWDLHYLENDFLKKFPDLQELDCSNGNLTDLSICDLDSLQTLHCYNNDLETLNITNLPALQQLNCGSNRLTILNITNLPALQRLNCSSNRLTTLNITNLPALQRLYCGINLLTTLNVRNLLALKELYCGNNRLTHLDVSNLVALRELYCGNNRLTTLQVENLPALKILSCSGNQLTTLDVGNLAFLKKLFCKGNKSTLIYGIEKCRHLDSFYRDDNNIYKFINRRILNLDEWCMTGEFGDYKFLINPEIVFFAIRDDYIHGFDIPENIFDNTFEMNRNGKIMKVYCGPHYSAIHTDTCIRNETRITTILLIARFCETVWNVIPNELLSEIFLCQDPFDMFQFDMFQ